MDFFQDNGNGLAADGVSLETIAKKWGTPTYVYSHQTLKRHVDVLKQSLEGFDHLICYAVKANSNLSILKLLGSQGLAFDAVSLGELLRVQAAGLSLERCIFSGVGKRDDEIEAALRLHVLYISVESAEELTAVESVVQKLKVTARVSLRVNPDVDAKTHPYISTGLRENKFGVAWEDVDGMVAQARRQPHTKLVGLSCHIGSQITSLTPFEDAAKRIRELVERVDDSQEPLRYIGMGGGLGIPYKDEEPPSPKAYGARLKALLAPLNKTLVLEPGRVLVGNAGLLLTRVVRQKTNGGRHYVLVDAGMNDLLRPALYQAHHTIQTVQTPPTHGPVKEVDVVGPVCESADAFARNCLLPPLQTGDLLAIRSAGAYGSVMASHYNARPRAAEVLCESGQARTIRQRESFDDMWDLELDANLI